ncbi:MAG: hypothetical protein HQK99_08075 [Nitrospirae bacterium]|nr:hypothetical protein [Nitrospirota bacterium]
MEVLELEGLPVEAIERMRQLADILKNDKGGALKMIDELIDEIQWDVAFSNSQDAIEKLAEEALREIEAGDVELMDLDKL